MTKWPAAIMVFLGTSPLLALPVGRIDVESSRTRTQTVLRLMDTREGAEFNPDLWARDVQRVKNTEIFYAVETSSRVENGAIILSLKLKNKFSLIPIFKYKQGGGTSLVTAGAYEVNLFNRYLEAGSQFESMNGKNGVVSWFRHPYLFSRRNKFGSEIYSHTVNLPLLTFRGNPQAHFDNVEVRWNARLEREWTTSVRAGLELSLYNNQFAEDNATPEKSLRNALFHTEHSLRPGFTSSVSPAITFGRVNHEGFYVRGHELSLKGEWAHRAIGSDFDFIRGHLHLLSAFRPRERINAAFQFRLGSKSGREFQHKFYLGGLDSVRGFLDGQFRGEHLWQGNFEIRPTLVERRLWTLQGNLFTDWSKTWDSTNFSVDGFAKPFISYGTGFRVIFPRIYRAVLRVDLAWTREPVRQFGFNLGLQQFF